MEECILKFVCLSENAFEPVKMSSGAVGFDLKR